MGISAEKIQIGICRFAQLTVDSGKWTVVVSPSGMDLNNNLQKYHVFFYSETFFGFICIKIVPKGLLNCQLSTVHCPLGRSPANSNSPASRVAHSRIGQFPSAAVPDLGGHARGNVLPCHGGADGVSQNLVQLPLGHSGSLHPLVPLLQGFFLLFLLTPAGSA